MKAIEKQIEVRKAKREFQKARKRIFAMPGFEELQAVTYHRTPEAQEELRRVVDDAIHKRRTYVELREEYRKVFPVGARLFGILLPHARS